MTSLSPLEIWATKIANTETYRNQSPEEQAADRREFFKQYVLPTIGDENLEQGYKTFQLATMPTEALYTSEDFLNLDEKKRKQLLEDNLKANGQAVTKKVRGKDAGEQLATLGKNALAAVTHVLPFVEGTEFESPGGAVEYSPEVDKTYEQFQDNPEVEAKNREAHLMSVGQPVRKGQRFVASVLGNDEAVKLTNDQIRKTEQLQKQFPASKATEVAADIGVTLAPSAKVAALTKTTQGAGLLTRFGNWIMNAAGQGAIAAPISTTSVEDSANMGREVLGQTGKAALVGAAATGVATGITSPTASEFLQKGRNWVRGGADDLGDDLISRIQAANPKMTPEQVLQEAQNAQQTLHTAPKPQAPTFMGASSNAQLADMQASIPKTDYNQILFDKFEQPVVKNATALESRADVTAIPQTSEYVKTKILPQTKAEFNIAKKQAIKTLEEDGKKFVNKVYADARTSGVLAEPLGISKNQLAARAEDLLSDPNIQKYGVQNLPSVKSLLAMTDGAAPLTVDDAMRFHVELANDFKATKAEGIKPFIDLVSETLDGNQSTGVQQLRSVVADYQSMLGENIMLTKEQFNAAGALERSFGTQPLMKALSSGSNAANISKAAVGTALPEGQLAEVLADQTLNKTTKAAVAADIMDTLNIQNLKEKGVKLDLDAFSKKYGDEAVADRMRLLFADDRDFLDNFEKLRIAANESSVLKTTTGITPIEGAGNAFKQALAGGGAQATGARQAVASGTVELFANAFNKKTRQYLRDAITDKSKTLKILDSAISYQKGKIKYNEIFDKYVAPSINQTAPKLGEKANERDKKSFEPMELGKLPIKKDLTNEKKSDIIKTNETSNPSTARSSSSTPTATAKKKSHKDLAFDVAVGTESNNQQFDANGKPLKSNKGAIGIAQIMPKTAPEAARLAGLKWDKERYLKDEKYNYALGKAYFNQQLKDFNGNVAHAYAAYNAGPGALKKALEKSKKTGQYWLALLPAETRNYVTKNVKNFNKLKT